MKIGEISNSTGVSQRMIRHFESMKLLTPQREGKYRVYSEQDCLLIKAIKNFQEQGLSLREIRSVLENRDEFLEQKLLETLVRNREKISDLKEKNHSILESLRSLKLNTCKEYLVQEGVMMKFLNSFEEKNVVRGRMPYLEVFYETFVHMSSNHYSMKWKVAPMKVLHSTDLLHIHEGIGNNESDLKIIVSSDEQQFRNAFVFFLSPELLETITGQKVSIDNLEDEKEANLAITTWVNQAMETFNVAWNATFTTLNLVNLGMIQHNDDLKKLYHDDEIFILTNLYTEGEGQRFSVGLPYRFVSIVYHLLKK